MIELLSGLCWIVASLAILFVAILLRAKSQRAKIVHKPRLEVCGERYGKARAGERAWGGKQ